MGVPAYVELQLHPERIADGRVEARVAALPTLGLSSAELYARFEAPVREARKRLKAEKGDAAPDAAGGDDTPRRLRDMVPPENRPRRILEDLTAALRRARRESEQQLNEVLVDFWMNHFNVYANKGLDRILVAFERETIRPLGAVRRPAARDGTVAHVFYLDNARSVADEGIAGRLCPGKFGRATAAAGKAPKGLNKTTPASSWSCTRSAAATRRRTCRARPRADGLVDRGTPRERRRFVFRAPARCRAEGRPRRAVCDDGMDEGEQAIRMLARRPPHRLPAVQRLVADAPPRRSCAGGRAFLATRGDLRRPCARS
jgi:hypothetical protein